MRSNRHRTAHKKPGLRPHPGPVIVRTHGRDAVRCRNGATGMIGPRLCHGGQA